MAAIKPVLGYLVLGGRSQHLPCRQHQQTNLKLLTQSPVLGSQDRNHPAPWPLTLWPPVPDSGPAQPPPGPHTSAGVRHCASHHPRPVPHARIRPLAASA